MADPHESTGTSPARAVEPVTLEIIRGSLGSTIRDMELLMERCAMSPFIKTATEEERHRRAHDLPLIDRGPGFGEAEARWRAATGEC
jgi:hypothetical protein